MALASYTDLKQAIQSWSKRPDILDVIDDFIDITESRINKSLEFLPLETKANLTASTSSRFLNLPSLYKKMRRLNIVSGGENFQIPYSPPERLVVSSSGMPKAFTITSQIEFDRVPDAAYTVEVIYESLLTPLSDSNTTNSILTTYPDLYLSGCLSACAMWERDFESVQFFDNQFESNMALANSREQKSRYLNPVARSTSPVA